MLRENYFILLPREEDDYMYDRFPSLQDISSEGWGLRLITVRNGVITNRTEFQFPKRTDITLQDVALEVATLLEASCRESEIDILYTFNPEKWLLPLIHIVNKIHPKEYLCSCFTSGRVRVVSLVTLLFQDPRIISLEDRNRFTLEFLVDSWCNGSTEEVVLDFIKKMG
jgi:hypothetical protein